MPYPAEPVDLLSLLDQLVAAVWVYDLSVGRIPWANRSALALWGAKDLDALRARDFSPVSEASRLRLQLTLERVHGGERSFEENWTFYPNGVATTVRCCLSGVHLTDGRPVVLLEGTVVHGADSQHDALRSIESMRHTPTQVTLFSVDGAVLTQNPAAQQVFGAGVQAAGFVARFADEAEGQAALQRLAADQPVSGEFRSRTRAGPRWHALDARLATDPATGRKIIVASQTDITDRVLAQRALSERSEELREALRLQAEANRERGLLLANISEGLVMVDTAGRVSAERSAVLDAWAEAPPVAPGAPLPTIWEYLGLPADRAAEMRLGWESLAEDVLPLELSLDQLPKELRLHGRTLRVEYKPVLAGGVLQQVMLVLRDVTGDLERARLEAEQRELLEATDRMLHNRDGFRDFFLEADGQVTRLLAEPEAEGGLPEDMLSLRRILHTLKGNSGLYGLSTLASLCHEIETRMAETGAGLGAADREALSRRWQSLRERLKPLIGHAQSERIELSREEYEGLMDAVQRGVPRPILLERLRSLRLQPIHSKLEHLAGQARALCRRLGRDEPEVTIQADGVRIPPERFGDFFGTLGHVVRNAVDHGVEPPAERELAGKRRAARLWLRGQLSRERLVIEIEDDGRGVDWERLRQKAQAQGLPVQTQAQLVRALFADGVSTREEVTDLSGRGVGLAAVRVACAALGGEVDVRSTPGRGTCFSFRFPGELARGDA